MFKVTSLVQFHSHQRSRNPSSIFSKSPLHPFLHPSPQKPLSNQKERKTPNSPIAPRSPKFPVSQTLIPNSPPDLALTLTLTLTLTSSSIVLSLPTAMTKEFAVPPVVFPAGGNPNAGGNLQQRRVPIAPFQPQRPSSSSTLPFMSFDIGTATSTSSTTIYGGPMAPSGGSANFEDEEPLLDELGIHPDQIWKKTKTILNPFRVNPNIHKDSDLSGPIILYLSLCLFQLLAGKIQFGVILGWIVVSSIFLYVVFNMLAGRNGKLNLHTCTSVIGYCMLPVVVLSAMSLFLPQGSAVRFGIAGVFVLWATRAATALMVALADGEEEHRGLVAYACFLIYTLFSLLVVF